MFRILKNLITFIKYLHSQPPPPMYRPHHTQLKRVASPLNARLCWTHKIPQAICLGFCDEKEDGKRQILISDHRKRLHVLDTDGALLSTLALPAECYQVECGWQNAFGTCILGKSDRCVYVIDRCGHILWKYSNWCGINEAHWGDLDRDGNDELVCGMNAWGGLIALTYGKNSLWKIEGIANVWSHTIVPYSSGSQACILATEASGAIRMYDRAGRFIKTFRPEGLYYSTLSAAVIDSLHHVQIAAL